MFFFIVPFILTIGCILAAVSINSVAFAWLAVVFAVLSILFFYLALEQQVAEERRWQKIRQEGNRHG